MPSFGTFIHLDICLVSGQITTRGGGKGGGVGGGIGGKDEGILKVRLKALKASLVVRKVMKMVDIEGLWWLEMA